MIASKVKLV